MPVTTFGAKYSLDNLVRPYLPRLAPAVMVSFHYAQQMAPSQRPRVPLLVDSGGFASLFTGAVVREEGDLGVVDVPGENGVELLHPSAVLDLQELVADVAFTLDFPILLEMPLVQARQRQALTMRNATWALANRRRRDLPLYAVVQGWDADSMRACVVSYVEAGFDGIAVGGLVPRSRNWGLVMEMVKAVREVIGNLPLHVFGLGKPEFVEALFGEGVDSVDSSAYVQLASEGRLWAAPSQQVSDPSPTDRMQLALCNLATATRRSLPLQISQLMFSTGRLASRPGRAKATRGGPGPSPLT